MIKFLQSKHIIPNEAEPGARVRELFVATSRLRAAKAEAKTLPNLEIGPIDVQWLQVLAEGWAAPLTGFMREDDYLQVNRREFHSSIFFLFFFNPCI